MGKENVRRRFLFGPWLDFLGLGGGSIIVMVVMVAFYPKSELARAILAATMLFLAHFVNHPHFAHSYQLFYRNFMNKAFSPESAIRHRYRFAGIMVPTLLATFFASAMILGSAPLLGLAANAMFFTVGWHYAKQGYGILMLDGVQKGRPFNPREKRHLLWNVHLAWPTNWLLTNNALAAHDFWGLTLIHPLIFQPHITANTSRYARCSVSICANFSINGRNLWSGQFGMCS